MLLKHPYVAMVTLDGCGNAAKLAEQIHQAGKQTAYALPYVLRETSGTDSGKRNGLETV